MFLFRLYSPPTPPPPPPSLPPTHTHPTPSPLCRLRNKKQLLSISWGFVHQNGTGQKSNGELLVFLCYLLRYAQHCPLLGCVPSTVHVRLLLSLLGRFQVPECSTCFCVQRSQAMEGVGVSHAIPILQASRDLSHLVARGYKLPQRQGAVLPLGC